MRAAPTGQQARLRQFADADSEHRRSKFYVWSEAEIDRLFGDDAEFRRSMT
jgi:uncharacterized protein YyaL (SSP411 family)